MIQALMLDGRLQPLSNFAKLILFFFLKQHLM